MMSGAETGGVSNPWRISAGSVHSCFLTWKTRDYRTGRSLWAFGGSPALDEEKQSARSLTVPLFCKRLSRIYCAPGIVVGFGDMGKSKAHRNPGCHGACLPVGQTGHHRTREGIERGGERDDSPGGGGLCGGAAREDLAGGM